MFIVGGYSFGPSQVCTRRRLRRPSSESTLQGSPMSSAKTTKPQTCGICFEPLQPQERRQELDCGHCYHENCITTWAQKKSVALSEACLYRCHIKKDEERFFDKDINPVQTESVLRTATTTAHDNNDNNDNNNNANVITNNIDSHVNHDGGTRSTTIACAGR